MEQKDRLQRILFIHKTLRRKGKHITTQTLADKFGISIRTVRRDLKLMKTQFGAPIAYDPIVGGYCYTREFTCICGSPTPTRSADLPQPQAYSKSPHLRIGNYRITLPFAAICNSSWYIAEKGSQIFALKLCYEQDDVLYTQKAKLFRRLNHPNIVALVDWGYHLNYLYMVFDFIHGTRLDRHITLYPDGYPEALSLIKQLCLALHHIHQQGLLHGRLYPKKLKVNSSGELKLTYFHPRQPTNSQAPCYGTLTDSFPLAYLPPELIAGQHPTYKSDQYCAGVIAYQLLTGKLPWDFQTPADLIEAKRKTTPPELLSANNSHIPSPDILPIIHRMISPDPDSRYPDLLKILQQLPSDSTESTLPTG